MPSESLSKRYGIPLCEPYLGGRERDYLIECVDTNSVSSIGPYVRKFEEAIAARVGMPFAVATSNGTSALHTALLVAGVGPGDEVIVSSLTFIAPANAVRYTGARPVFMDADPETWQMDCAKLKEFVTHECENRNGALYNRSTGAHIKCIVPVHVLGHPVDMDPLLEISRENDIKVIEDATEALGSKYKGRNAGALGDGSCFSFNGNKIITTGGGGMFVTRHEEWAARAKYLVTQAKSDPAEYIHGDIGYNYRLTNIQAAVGYAQLEQIDSFIEKKRSIAARYAAAFADLPGITSMPNAEWAYSIHWMYTAHINPSVSGISRKQMQSALRKQGIETRPLWQPMHLSPAHAGCQAYKCEVAGELHDNCISLPCSVGLSESDQQTVINAFLKVLSR